MVFPAHWRGWWWDGQNDSLLSPTRRCNHHWSDVLARMACTLLARTSRWATTQVDLVGLASLHPGASFVLGGLDKASSSGRRKLNCWSVRSWGSFCAASLLMVLRNLSVWHWHEQFKVDWNVLQFNSYRLTCANPRIVQGASCGSSGQHSPCWKPIGFHKQFFFWTKVTKPHRLQTKAFSNCNEWPAPPWRILSTFLVYEPESDRI